MSGKTFLANRNQREHGTWRLPANNPSAAIPVQRAWEANTDGESHDDGPNETHHLEGFDVNAPDVTGETKDEGKLATRIRARIGGGIALDPVVQRRLETSYEADLAGVRVHTDPEADSLARSVQATAFTTGSDIFFRSGAYDPNSEGGGQLIAHEVAHTLQQAAGPVSATPGPGGVALSDPSDADEQAADRAATLTVSGSAPVAKNSKGTAAHGRARSGSPAAGTLALQRKVQTLGGEWDTDKYTIAKNGAGREIGLDIDLKFTPQDPVDAKKIGLTQTVKAMDDGKDDFVDEAKKKRAVPAGQTGEGTVIDQLSQYSNPLYATGARGAHDTLADTPTPDKANWGEHGWRYKDEHGALKTQDAHLKDTPRRPNHKNNAQQVFEVTALAIEGTQKDTYYGSVQWGWQRDGSGTFTQLPLSIISTGVPSATFTAAAEAWNKGKSSTGEEDVKLPIAGESPGATMPDKMSYPDLTARIKTLEDAIAKLPDGPDKTNKQFECEPLKKEKASRIGDFPVPDPNAETQVA